MIRILILALVCSLLSNLSGGEALEAPAWTAPKQAWEVLTVTRSDAASGPELTFVYAPPEPKKRRSAMRSAPWTPDRTGDGVRFEVRGDGSSFYGSICLNTAGAGYEAIFPLAATTWTTITLRWSDFVLNHLPFNKDIAAMTMEPVPDPGALRQVGFGFGNPLHKYFPEQATFTIRNLQVVGGLPPLTAPPSTVSTGFTRTRAALAAHRPLRILLLGDSITDLGGNRSYGVFCGERLKAAHGVDCTVVNAGIGGASVRYGTIVLPRSLAAMPDPDLVCVMFGANDCKEVEFRPDMTPQTFAARLGTLIERIRRATGGNADIALLSGVPRLDQDRLVTAGLVEKIAPGVALAATTHRTAYVDSLSAYLALDPQTRKPYYMDTIHQNADGLRFLGDRLFDAITAKP